MLNNWKLASLSGNYVGLSQAIWCNLALLQSALSVVNVTVLFSVPLPPKDDSQRKALASDDACELLKARSRTRWNSGMFIGCTASSLMLTVAMNETKLQMDYQSMIVFERAWRVNRLLNENAGDCLTTVTTGEERDVFESAPVMDAAVNASFILVGPINRRTCRKLIFKKEFVNGHFSVDGCSKIETSQAHPSFKSKLTRYKLIVNSDSLYFDPSDYSLPFVAELNGFTCGFNGYWPPIHL
ncbi:unnamed protein product [Dicrocoelium dendriticum]|nr:unnamed protein product [Dicrocoelium dendriticum]